MYCVWSLHKFINKVLKALLMPGVVSWRFVYKVYIFVICSNMLRGLEFNYLQIKKEILIYLLHIAISLKSGVFADEPVTPAET